VNNDPVNNDPVSNDPAALDAADPLARFRGEFLVPKDSDVVSYLDGNSLGRPLIGSAEQVHDLVERQWAGRLIRGWTDGWLNWPLEVGDQLGAVALGAGPGQAVIADSTTVLIYKLARAALGARPGRRRVVLDTDNFPTDRYVLEGIAADRDLELVWIETDPREGIRPEQVAEAVDEQTALVLFSHVAYRSAWVADVPAITRIAHDAGALAMWDVCHSAGSVPIDLDGWDVDLAVGCTYKYLNAGPGAPAFAYVRRDLLADLRQPIWGWMGHRASFEMGPGYEPADGSRALLSGTPPILGMAPLRASLAVFEAAGIEAVRAKSVLLTEYVVALADEWLAPLGVEVASPREPARRGGHVMLNRAGFGDLIEPLWERGVIPDYRRPDGLRIGPAPLSTSFAEVHRGLAVLRDLLAERP
jgi:kynureninase